MFTTPLLMSVWVVVSLSHFTRYASGGVTPWNAPWGNRLCINAPMLRRISAHNGSSFGSKTTHCVPRYRLSSRKSANRRTGTYFHSDASASLPTSVREPQTTLPAAGEGRRALTPSGLTIPFSPSVSFEVSSITPPSDASSPAGAFHTPREASVRAITPATEAAGGKAAGAPVSGSVILRYGK